MAVDSRDKRASVLAYALPIGGPLPDADGTVGVGDRAQVVYLYPADNLENISGAATNTIPVPTQSAAGEQFIEGAGADRIPVPTQSAAGEQFVEGSATNTVPVPTQAAAGNIAGAPSVTVTGTALGATQEQIQAGGETIVLTLTGSTWVDAGVPFDGVKDDISNGISGDGITATSWDFTVPIAQALNLYAGIVRTSDTVVTITLPAVPSYSIDADETITVTVPQIAYGDTEQGDLAGGTFQILVEAATEEAPTGGYRSGRWPRPGRWPEEDTEERRARIRAERERLGIVEPLEAIPAQVKKPSRAGREKRRQAAEAQARFDQQRLLVTLEAMQRVEAKLDEERLRRVRAALLLLAAA